MGNYEGNDNYGKPKTDYIDGLRAMDDMLLREACEQMIWLSAYANNNPRSDYHWQCDACYDEAVGRGKAYIYSQAHHAVSSSV